MILEISEGPRQVLLGALQASAKSKSDSFREEH